ncbi:MAG TPA: substrate-binding domain-containing protein [Capsulimonadaceae bacterium]|jgi:DNA-binding LacI/PurR family transcriptional regulator
MVTVKASSSSKYRIVRDSLEQAIRGGEFMPGDQFPAEQMLATQFGVSYMTARRAICELVEADLLERRSRNGTFVRAHGSKPTQTTVLNLITFEYDCAATREFLREGVRGAENKGWSANVVRLAKGQQDPAVRAIRNGGYSILMLHDIPTTSALAEAILAAPEKVIAMQYRCTLPGVSSILYDEGRTIDIAVDHLRSFGHRDIALAVQVPTVETSQLQVAAFRRLLAAEFGVVGADERVIEVVTPRYECPSQRSYDAVSQYFRKRGADTTALITLGDEITLGTLPACRDARRSVPDAVSIINVGDAPLMALAEPAITSVDVDFDRQLRVAMQILERRASVPEDPDPIHLVEPRLISRDSVRKVLVRA